MTNINPQVAAKLRQLADEWQCDGHDLCYAQLTNDGNAIQHFHHTDCPHIDPDDIPDAIYSQFGTEAAIDLVAGRRVEIPPPHLNPDHDR